MAQNDDDHATRDAAEVRGRIADILGYCNLDGQLHDPRDFDKKFLRSKWVCPDCSTVAGKVAYKRANELQWMLVSQDGGGGSRAFSAERDATESDDEDGQEDENELEDDGDGDTEGTAGDTDSEDVKARIENAQEDIEEFEEAAEQ